MERLRFRLWVTAGLFIVIGGMLAFAGRPQQVKREETWIAKQLPEKVGPFQMVPNAEREFEYCTYRMNESTYKTLQPWGIVARVFTKGDESYDVVVIGSNAKESFHDPKVCFGAQGWVLGPERVEYIDTKSRGQVPVSVVEMTNQGKKTLAVYFYKTVSAGFTASSQTLRWDMLKHKLVNMGKDDEGAFLRIIPTHDNPDLGKLKQFIGDWLDEANTTSNGYY